METLLRTHDSPVPTQTVFEFEGSIATAPMDCTSSRSKTGLKVVPPFTDFQTPPLAAPTKTVIRPLSSMASSAAMLAPQPKQHTARFLAGPLSPENCERIGSCRHPFPEK